MLRSLEGLLVPIVPFVSPELISLMVLGGKREGEWFIGWVTALENEAQPVSGKDLRMVSLSTALLSTILYLAIAFRCFFPTR